MKRSIQSALPLLAVLGALALAPAWGCRTEDHGDSTPEVEGPSTLSTPIQEVLVAEGEFTNLLATQGGKHVAKATKEVPFTSSIPSSLSPTIRGQVNWTLPEDDIVIAFYPGGCTSRQFGVGACAALAEGVRSGKQAESFVWLYPPGSYVLGIQNRGPRVESGAFQVVVRYRAQ